MFLEMTMETESEDVGRAEPVKRRFTTGQLLLILLGAVVLTAGATFWLVRTYVFPSEFQPVELSQREQQVLNGKLRRLGWQPPARNQNASANDEPEPYSERDEDREINLTEEELNSLLARDTDLARRVAIDLSDDLASAKILIPVPEDFPVMSGRILRVNAGMELAYTNQRPVVVLKGVSVMGVPIPNAWLGNLKNVDLVREFGDSQGFWKAFADGVDYVQVRQGELQIRLKE